MKTVSLIFGILSLLGMFLGFIPCFGAFNWLNIPFAVVGLIISIVAYTKADGEPKGNATAGIVMCSIAIVFGLIRLIAGGGII